MRPRPTTSGPKHSFPQPLGLLAANTQTSPYLGIVMVGEHCLTQRVFTKATASNTWLMEDFKGLVSSPQFEMILKAIPAPELSIVLASVPAS